MLRYLLEDVTLDRSERSISIHIRYKGYATQSVVIDAPLRCYEAKATDPAVLNIIDDAAETLVVEDIVSLLNKQGLKSGTGMSFNPNMVKCLMRKHSIPTIKERYLDRGYVVCATKAASLGITPKALMSQIRSGKYQEEYVSVNIRNECLFPGEQKNDTSIVSQ
jgi:hypothetical protein